MSEEQPGRDSPQEGRRESIWSVAPRFLKVYLFLFTAFFVCGTGYLVYYEVAHSLSGSGHDVAVAVIKSIGSVAIGAAGVSLFVTEMVGGSMVLATYLQRKLIDEPKAAREREMAAREKETAAREKKLAEQNDEIVRLTEENARLRDVNESIGEFVRLTEENARLKEQLARLREENGQPLNQDSSNPNQD